VASDAGGNCGVDTASAITDGGHNLDDGTMCGFSIANGSLNNADPQLDPAGLKDNGGPTQTIALQPGSPAINAGSETICAAPPVNNLDIGTTAGLSPFLLASWRLGARCLLRIGVRNVPSP
jgi:hypothetical protein